MVASLPPLACAICDHPITHDALRRRARCPRCAHRHGLHARHRALLSHIQRRRIQAAVDRSAAAEASAHEPGAGGRFLAAILVAAALPYLLRPLADRVDLGGEAWLVIAVGLVVAVAMAAALHVLLGEEDPAATVPVRVDALSLDRAVLDAEAAAWRAGVQRRGIALRRRAGEGRPGAASLAIFLGVGALLGIAGDGAGVAVPALLAIGGLALSLALALRSAAARRRRPVVAARRIADALGPGAGAELHPGAEAIAAWAASRWAGPLALEGLDHAAAVALERDDFELLTMVVGERYAPGHGDVRRLLHPEQVQLLVPFVTPPQALRAADTAVAAAIVRDLQAQGWHLAHDPAVGLQATRLAPSEALHFTHAQLVQVAQATPALLDLAAALGGVPPRELAARELTTLQPATG